VKVTHVELTLTPHEQVGPAALVAAATVEFDASFVVKGVKVIERADGSRFVEMPDRPRKAACSTCRKPFPIHYAHCNRCRAANTAEWVGHVFVDICHPVTHALRDEIDAAVMDAYRTAVATRQTA
jgi:DNA-binding cell septation regulator SpoVG